MSRSRQCFGHVRENQVSVRTAAMAFGDRLHSVIINSRFVEASLGNSKKRLLFVRYIYVWTRLPSFSLPTILNQRVIESFDIESTVASAILVSGDNNAARVARVFDINALHQVSIVFSSLGLGL